MKRFLAAWATALTLLLCASTGARADSSDPGSVAWSYNWSPGTPQVSSDSSSNGSIVFSNDPPKRDVQGPSKIVATSLNTHLATLSSDNYTFTGNQGAYTLNLALSLQPGGLGDVPAHDITKNLTFTGTLSDHFSIGNSNIGNAFGPNSTQSVQIGAYNFTVSLIEYASPGLPSVGDTPSPKPGTITAYVDIAKVSVAQVPEPSTMLLSGLGLTFLGGMSWRKRRQGRPAVAV